MTNDSNSPSPSTDAHTNAASASDALPRRDFLKVAGAGAGAALLGGASALGASGIPEGRRVAAIRTTAASPDIVVIGAGAWGSWTALHLRKMGAKVTVVDSYGAGNSRSTSGDETRGVRSSYGDRDTGEMWMLWAREAIDRWRTFDADWGRELELPLFFHTGDLILRVEAEPFTTRTQAWWS